MFYPVNVPDLMRRTLNGAFANACVHPPSTRACRSARLRAGGSSGLSQASIGWRATRRVRTEAAGLSLLVSRQEEEYVSRLARVAGATEA